LHAFSATKQCCLNVGMQLNARPYVECASCMLHVQVLKFETSRQPQCLGGSVFGYNDAYKQLHSFLRRWRAAKPPPCKPLPPQHQSSIAPLGSPLTQQINAHMSMDHPEVATAADFGSQQWSDRLAGEPFEEGLNNGDQDRGSNTAACTAPYIVSVDVSRAFDNIDAGMLLGIIEPLLRSPEYLIIKYSEVCPVSDLHCCRQKQLHAQVKELNMYLC